MKVSEQKSAEPGGKNAQFPAWVLRYANQPASLPSINIAGFDAGITEEQNYVELSHFEEVLPNEPDGSEPVKDNSEAE